MAQYIDLDNAIESIRNGDGTPTQKLFAECCLLCVPTADVAPKAEIARELAEEYTALARHYVLDRDLYLAAFKNALAYAEAEIKQRYN